MSSLATARAFALAVLLAAPGAVSGIEGEGELALETFDHVWEKVRETHFDYEQVRSRWEDAREALRPKAREVTDRGELRALLTELLGRLETSHYAILESGILDSGPDRPPAAQGRGAGTTGIALRVVDRRVRVVSVASDSAGADAGVRPGDVVEKVDGEAVGPGLERILEMDQNTARRWALSFFEFRINDRVGQAPAGSSLELGIYRAGERQDLDMVATERDGEPVRLGHLPPMHFEFSSRKVEQGETDCVGVIAFSAWVPQLNAALAEAMDKLGRCRGVVLDLRGNPGGVVGLMMPVAGHLVSEPTLLGTLMGPQGQLEFRAQPRRVASDGSRVEPFGGAVAVLVDGLSMSTSEMFAAGLQATGRARVFGSPTPGMALPAMLEELPNGDRLMYAFADYLDPDGNRVEGAGVKPDQPMKLRSEDLRAGRDAPLQAALDWMQERD